MFSGPDHMVISKFAIMYRSISNPKYKLHRGRYQINETKYCNRNVSSIIYIISVPGYCTSTVFIYIFNLYSITYSIYSTTGTWYLVPGMYLVLGTSTGKTG